MTDAQIIVLATPVFLLLIAVELAIGWRRGRLGYSVADAVNSIGLGVMSQVVNVFSKVVGLGLYALVHDGLAPWHLPQDAPWVWIAGLLLYDFLYYWHHRLGHEVAVLWAAHAVHHQSEDYNLSTALRQTSTGWLFGWVFYLPMALLGFPPLVFAVVALVDLLYQYWVHTEQVGKLGAFDRWFCSPSNHRAHHAVNDRYLDRNYGGILIVWDRLFGTFVEEDDADRCIYGTRTPLRSLDPVWANLHVYADLAFDAWHTRRWSDKLRVWWKPPGWRPDDVAARFPKPAFDLAARTKYMPGVSPRAAWGTLVLFAGVLAATSAFLWWSHLLAGPVRVAAGVAIIAALWGLGAATRRATAAMASPARPASPTLSAGPSA